MVLLITTAEVRVFKQELASGPNFGLNFLRDIYGMKIRK